MKSYVCVVVLLLLFFFFAVEIQRRFVRRFIFFSLGLLQWCHSKWLSHSQYLFDSLFCRLFRRCACILSGFGYFFFTSLIPSMQSRERDLFSFGPKSNLNTCASTEKKNWNPQRVQLLKIQPKTTWREKKKKNYTLKERTQKQR